MHTTFPTTPPRPVNFQAHYCLIDLDHNFLPTPQLQRQVFSQRQGAKLAFIINQKKLVPSKPNLGMSPADRDVFKPDFRFCPSSNHYALRFIKRNHVHSLLVFIVLQVLQNQIRSVRVVYFKQGQKFAFKLKQLRQAHLAELAFKFLPAIRRNRAKTFPRDFAFEPVLQAGVVSVLQRAGALARRYQRVLWRYFFAATDFAGLFIPVVLDDGDLLLLLDC